MKVPSPLYVLDEATWVTGVFSERQVDAGLDRRLVRPGVAGVVGGDAVEGVTVSLLPVKVAVAVLGVPLAGVSFCQSVQAPPLVET